VSVTAWLPAVPALWAGYTWGSHLLTLGSVWRGPRAGRKVALTFDDGPDPEQTPRVLDLLAAHGAKATFFLIGERAARAWSRLADMVERDGFGPAREPDVRAFGPTFAAGHPEVVRDLAQRTRLGDPRAYAATTRAFGSYGWTADLGRVRAPALILQGLDDALTATGGSVILSRGIRRSRLVMVPGAGHNLPIEMPALFVTAVLAFLAGLDL